MRVDAIETRDAIKRIRAALEEKKGENIVVLDVRKVSTITDYYIIATGANSRHIKALIEECDRTMAETGAEPYRKSGTPESAWMILDYIDYVLHVFSEESREHFALEALWKDAPRVP